MRGMEGIAAHLLVIVRTPTPRMTAPARFAIVRALFSAPHDPEPR